jgi:hypothetical protein
MVYMQSARSAFVASVEGGQMLSLRRIRTDRRASVKADLLLTQIADGF